MAKKTPKLTDRHKMFIKIKQDNPNISNRVALLKAGYNPKDDKVAGVRASQIMALPAVKMELAKHAQVFESVILGTAKDWGDHEKPRQREIALNASMFAHDKIFGKATVKIEQQVSVVKIAINLTGDGEEAPREFIDAEPVLPSV